MQGEVDRVDDVEGVDGGRLAAPERAQAKAAASSSSTLDQEADSVIAVARAGARLRLVAKRCRKRMCDWCGPHLGLVLLGHLKLKAGLFRWPGLITLTVDRAGTVTHRPGGFSGPAEAYDVVRTARYVARLLGKLHVTRWIAVLEPQEAGWPHWHILFDRGELPGGRLNYDDMHLWWRDVWKVGLAHDSGILFDSAEGAVRYVCKYLIKHPRSGYPEWMWDRRLIRFVSASRAVGALFPRGVPCIPGDEVHEDYAGGELADPEPASGLTYREAVGACGSRTVILQEYVTDSGEVGLGYVGELEAPLSLLLSNGARCVIEAAGLTLPERIRESVERPGGKVGFRELVRVGRDWLHGWRLLAQGVRAVLTPLPVGGRASGGWHGADAVQARGLGPTAVQAEASPPCEDLRVDVSRESVMVPRD